MTLGWNIEEVKYLLNRYYPDGVAWEAKIPEAEFGFHLPSQYRKEGECRDIKGIAVDLENDGMADLFLYDSHCHMSVTAKSLDSYLRPIKTKTIVRYSTCEEKAAEFQSEAFPMHGELLPDTKGKITGLMFKANDQNDFAFLQMIELRPDIDYQVLYNIDLKSVEWLADASYQKAHGIPLPILLAEYMLQSEYSMREGFANISFYPDYDKWGEDCDFINPCGHAHWVRDPLFIGRNEAGDLMVGAKDLYNEDTLAQVVVQAQGAVFFDTGEYMPAGDVLSSSTHLFVKKGILRDFSAESNFAQVFAYGKRVVCIEKGSIDSADHIDMLITPTEDIKDGKPVVFLAQAHYLGKKAENGEYLDEIAKQLEQEGFFVARVPYVYTGGSTFAGSWQGSNLNVYSFNNVLMENYVENGQRVKRVYMPWYGFDYRWRDIASPWFSNYNPWSAGGDPKIKPFNQQAKAVYESFGYEVVPIKGLDYMARHGGGLRCLTQVTNRSTF